MTRASTEGDCRTAVRRASVLGLAVLLAAATAAADVVITADEVIRCWSVEPAGADSVRFTLPRLQPGILSTFGVYEIRLSYSSRVAKLAAQLPQVRVRLDWGEAVPVRAVRAREMLRLRMMRAREAHAEGLPGYADVVDPLRRSSPSELAAKCGDMEFVLRECGRNDETVAGLLREVNREHDALRRIWPQAVGRIACGGCGGLLGGLTGDLIGDALHPQESPINFGEGGWSPGGGGCAGCPVGCAVGSAVGVAIAGTYHRNLIARHCDRVNELVRRVNRALLSVQ